MQLKWQCPQPEPPFEALEEPRPDGGQPFNGVNRFELPADDYEALFCALSEGFEGKWNAEYGNRNDGTLTFGKTVFVRAKKEENV